MKRAMLVSCILVMVSFLAVAQQAQWTIWRMPSDKSFPGKLVWMVDDSLFVALHSPQALARFEPDANRLIAWNLLIEPSEFVLRDSGLLFTGGFDAKVGWLHPDANYIKYWNLPSPDEQPIFAMQASFGNGVENMWYLDWGLGRLGLFAPPVLTVPRQGGDDEPQVISVTRTSGETSSSSKTVKPEVHKEIEGIVQSAYQLDPVVSAPFREWKIATPDQPPYAFLEDDAGEVWIPDPIAGTLLCLDPMKNTVTAYKLPSHTLITSLALSPDRAHICFLALEKDATAKIGLLQIEQDSVIMWKIPGGKEIDALGLISTEDALWFCDRDGSAVYRFVPETGMFTWWNTGGDDRPLYIEPGNPGEFWVSWEYPGAIARLTLPSSQDSPDTEL